jgi:uncharacterized membrane protein YhaH (DUF805 family)
MASGFGWYFLSMRGCIGRQEFCLGFSGVVLIDILVARVGAKLESGPQYYSDHPPLFDGSIVHALLAFSLWPFAAILVKRLHDVNVSGWWGLVILFVPHLSRTFDVPSALPYLLIAALLGMLPGRRRNNRFGPDPQPHLNI